MYFLWKKCYCTQFQRKCVIFIITLSPICKSTTKKVFSCHCFISYVRFNKMPFLLFLLWRNCFRVSLLWEKNKSGQFQNLPKWNDVLIFCEKKGTMTYFRIWQEIWTGSGQQCVHLPRSFPGHHHGWYQAYSGDHVFCHRHRWHWSFQVNTYSPGNITDGFGHIPVNISSFGITTCGIRHSGEDILSWHRHSWQQAFLCEVILSRHCYNWQKE